VRSLPLDWHKAFGALPLVVISKMSCRRILFRGVRQHNMPTQDEVTKQLNQRFPTVDGGTLLALASRVAAGTARFEQACTSLREMGFEEVEVTAAKCADVEPIPLASSQRQEAPPASLRSAPRANSAAPIRRDAGGEAKASAPKLSGAPREEVAKWAHASSKYLPHEAVNVDQWRRDIGGDGHSPSRGRPSEPSFTVPEQQRRPSVTLTDQLSHSGSSKSKSLEAAILNVHHGGTAADDPRTTAHAAASHSPPSGLRSRTSDPSARKPNVVHDDRPVNDGEVVLYMTTITSERMVRDRVRSMERQLFLHSIPYHAMDVSENRFMRKQLTALCGGVDRGLPLLFVGDKCVGTYDEVQELIDDNKFLGRLAACGYHHSALVTSDAAAIQPASPVTVKQPAAAQEWAAAAPPQNSRSFDNPALAPLSRLSSDHRATSGPSSPMQHSGVPSTTRPVLRQSTSGTLQSPHRGPGGTSGDVSHPAPHAGGPAVQHRPLLSPVRKPAETPSSAAAALSASRHFAPSTATTATVPASVATTWTQQGGMTREARLERWHRML
jgi:hypothetical protein